MPKINLNGKQVQYEVSVRRVRYVRIYMTPEGKLWIVSPTKKVEQFLKEKEDWILSKLQKIEKAKQLSGFPYLGKFYSVKNGKKFEISGEGITLPSEEKLEKTLRKELKILITPIVHDKSEYLGVKPKKIFIRKQKTRWGSCSPRGNLNFNLAMLALPLELIDYLVTHETAHLIEMNHSKRFWKLVSHFHPDWRRKRRELKEWWIIIHNNSIWKQILEGER
ncbi:M48 family metallopeptidase [Thermococcus argininiproducens]|uniref:M48 family metallopeptidase n=1 Tax=Thermococcus argininiproducens TaxID=2866384 RepID=A0A9E7SDA4_9EURY|nr:SprT family zinc-dependent metalloprotease [Thermococcus argininiproducens]USH00626.1 M48 family metallopeptidase [Thermococcus argininiproducens]